MEQDKKLVNLFADTVRMGGNLIFLIDNGPENILDWLNPVSSDGRVPFARRKLQDLSTGFFSTRPEDLILFFSDQEQYLNQLRARVQGQRLLLGKDTQVPIDQDFDYVWPSCFLNDWKRVWIQVTQELEKSPGQRLRDSSGAPCLFLDRDDVIVKNIPYNKDPDKVELVPGIEKLIQRAHQIGFWVAMVTNQSGIGRGWISWLEYKMVHQKTLELLAAKGCWLDECVWATYIEGSDLYSGRVLAGLRKPRNGMFQIVNSKLNVDFPKSVMVGDSATDLIAAQNAGIKHLYLLESEKVEAEKRVLEEFNLKKVELRYSILKNLEEVQLF